jgi:tRNA1(Val) A37 N6-methylase TrmN6
MAVPTFGPRAWYVKAMQDPEDPLSDDAITGAFRIFQRVRGHRYSIDDVATAWEAVHERPAARRAADLGCGIGSVTLVLAHKLPEARIEAVEAQAVSFALAERNVARNGLSGRVRVHAGDLRDPALRERFGGGDFDLVTGTPPYFDPSKSSPSTDEQRTYARIEMRGGVEDYLRAGARLLAPHGRMVVCGDAKRPDRVIAGAAAASLVPLARRDVVPREGKGALFTIWTLGLEGSAPVQEREPIVARDAAGARLPIQRELRRSFDLDLTDEGGASPPVRERRAR